MKLAFHIHTYHSFDCLTRPKRIISAAKANGIDTIIVTDHGTIKGAIETREIAKNTGVEVIIGAEYYSNEGDIIGLFLSDEIVSNDYATILREIKDQGGISILPHPFRTSKFDPAIANDVDIIEIFNPRSSQISNEKSFNLAQTLGKPIIGGCDAHSAAELSNCVNIYNPGNMGTKQALLYSPDETIKSYTFNKLRYRSKFIGAVRKRNLLNMGKALYRYVKYHDGPNY